MIDRKKIFLLITLSLLILSITSISATDNSTNDIKIAHSTSDATTHAPIAKTEQATTDNIKIEEPATTESTYNEVKNNTKTITRQNTSTTKEAVSPGDNDYFEPRLQNITVHKYWSDLVETYRPSQVTVNLLANDKIVDTCVLSSNNSWQYTFENKVIFDEKGEYTYYSVTEEKIPYYKSYIAGDYYFGFDIMNIQLKNMTFKKVWDDDNNKYGQRPGKIILKLSGGPPKWKSPRPLTSTENEIEENSVLTSSSNVLRSSKDYTLDENDRITIELSEDNNWTAVLKNVPAFEEYGYYQAFWDIEEFVPRGYYMEPYEYTYSEKDNTVSYTITNKALDKISIPIVKIWNDGYLSKYRPEHVKINLLANGRITDSLSITGNKYDAYWYGEFSDLPVVSETGEPIQYSVSEEVPENYAVNITDLGANGFEISNTLLKNITVKKVWNDEDNQLKIRPKNVTVSVYRFYTMEALPSYYYTDDAFVTNITLTEDNDWSYVLENLEAYDYYGQYYYKFKEVNPRGYAVESETTSYEGEMEIHTLTNRVTPIIDITVTKIWEDEESKSRPSSVKINLLANGKSIDSRTLTGPSWDSIWFTRFDDLPLLDENGNFIDYNITEDVPAGYIQKTVAVDYNTFEIFNVPCTNIDIRKIWLDGDDELNKRPKAIQIKVYALIEEAPEPPKWKSTRDSTYTSTDYPTQLQSDKDYSDTVYPLGEVHIEDLEGDYELITVINITSDDDWSYLLENMPLYRDNRKIHYDIVEIVPEGYELIKHDIVQGDIEVHTFTNKLTPINITVTKQWDDNNIYWSRPDDVKINLLADNKVVDTITLTGSNTDNVWTGKFENLPVVTDDNKIINYSIREEDIGYISTVTGNASSGFKIVNSRYSNITVKKVWLDADNTYKKRPGSITVNLYNGNTFVKKITLNADHGWSSFIDKLPYDPDANYRFVEESVDGYEFINVTLNGDVYEIRNKLNPENVTVEKVWNDHNNIEGLRPDSIIFDLNENTYDLSDKNNWKTVITVDLVDSNGKLINYHVSEHPVKGYTTKIEGNVIAGYVITNSRSPEYINLTVSKTWDDNHNQDGKRPAQIRVRLYQNNKLNQTVALNAANGWKHDFTKLQKYVDGSEVTYTIEEEAVDGYITSYNGFNIINRYTPEVTEIRVTKKWNDNNDQDRIRPSSITVELEANGVLSRTVSLTAANGWSYTFTGLARYEKGNPIRYSIHEINIPDGYDVSYDGFTIINTHSPEVTEVNVIKQWNDTHNQDGLRPGNVRVQLYGNNHAVGSSVVLNAANNWEHTFDNLAKYDAGVLINYRVDEVAVPEGYSKTVTHNGNNYIIVNTHKPSVTSVKVTKTWDDNNNQDGKRPKSITVELHADGELQGTATLNSENAWIHTFRNLAEYYNGKKVKYDVVELGIPSDYTVSYNGYNIINTYKPEVTEVSVIKEWEDDHNRDNIRPNNITIQLYKNGKTTGTPITLNQNNNWTHLYTQLPKYENGQPITYTIDETNTPQGYTKKVQGNENSFIIINTHKSEVINLTVNKIWDDADNNDHKRPSSIIVELLADDEVYDRLVLSEDNGWTYTASNLPKYDNGKEIVYTVFELNVPDMYTVSYDGYTIVNSYKPEVTEVSVIKEWEDDHNRDNIRPNNITIQLYKNGKTTGTPITLNQNNNWTHLYTQLPKYENGQPITYTIDETNTPQGYTKLVNHNGNDYIIINIHSPETITYNVTKTWNDSSDIAGKRPSNVTVDLFADGELYDTVVLNSSSNWTYTFEDLPKYDQGKAIHYVVYEVDVPEDYIVSYNNGSIINTYNPDVTQVNVIKVWNDSHNNDGKRPNSVSVQLYADGKAMGSPVVLNADNNWEHTFNDLNKIVAGKVVNYTVDEVNVPVEYTKTVAENNNNYIITNTYIASVTNITVSKVWNDSQNRDGLRPENITVDLFADGELYQQVLLNSTTWSHTFTDLPVYFEGKAINYVVYETSIPEGYVVSYEGYTIVNTHEAELVQVEVIKQWDDNFNSDNKRPDSITIQLYANGNKSGSPVVLNDKNKWMYSFDNLAKYANGTLIKYTVDEISVPDGYTKVIENSSHTFVITNVHEAGTTNITVNKVWNDSHNQDGLRPENITVDLFGDGELYDTVVLNSSSWSYTFTDLPVYSHGKRIVYTVYEYGIPEEYVVSYDGYTIINTHVPSVTEVVLVKQWNDDHNRDGLRPASVNVQLYADGVKVGNPVRLSSANNWEHIFTNLAKYDHGHEIVYTASEAYVSGYTSKVTNTDNTIILVNTHKISTVRITVNKVWDDNHNQDGLRPNSVTVDLFGDGELVKTVRLTSKNNWTYVFNSLPLYFNGKEIKYSVYEVSLSDDYTVSYDGYTIINTHNPEVTEVNVVKLWDDNHDSDGLRTKSVTVELYADGKSTGDIIVLTGNNGWEYVFANLPKYADGKEIVYSVKELKVPNGYSSSIKKVDDTFIITNKHDVFMKNITVHKVWNDKENQGVLRPDNISVQLLADGKVIESIVLNDKNNWTYTFNDLNKFASGIEVNYSVVEVDVPEKYAVSYDGYVITNTLNIPPANTTKFAWGWYFIGINGSYNYNHTGNISDDDKNNLKLSHSGIISRNNVKYTGIGRYGKYYNRYNKYAKYHKYGKNNRYHRGHGQGAYQHYRLYIYLLKEYLDGNLTYAQFIAILDENDIRYFDVNGTITIDYDSLEDVPNEIVVKDTEEVVPTSSDNVDTSNPDKHSDPVIDSGRVEVEFDASAKNSNSESVDVEE